MKLAYMLSGAARLCLQCRLGAVQLSCQLPVCSTSVQKDKCTRIRMWPEPDVCQQAQTFVVERKPVWSLLSCLYTHSATSHVHMKSTCAIPAVCHFCCLCIRRCGKYMTIKQLVSQDNVHLWDKEQCCCQFACQDQASSCTPSNHKNPASHPAHYFLA